MNIILASNSPRRKELLSMIKVPYEAIPSHFDEQRQEGISKEEQAKRLSYGKAKDVFDRTSGDRMVIGSDTLVYCNGKPYGKPKTEEEAIQMIQELKNKDNEVITGLAVLVEKQGNYEEYLSYDTTKVHIKDMMQEEIIAWIHSGEAMDKAGAYAVQSSFCVFIDKIEGNYFSTVGLPLHQLYEVMKKYEKDWK